MGTAINLFLLGDEQNPARALRRSFTDEGIVAAPPVIRSDRRRYRIHHILTNPNPVPGRPFIHGTRPYALRLGAGIIGAAPTAGTYTLTGPLGGTSAAINLTDTALQIRDKLRAAWTSGENINITVISTGGLSTYYRIDWGVTGAVSGSIGQDTTGLVPTGSSASIENTQEGSASLNEQWEVQLNRALVMLNTTWDAFPGVTTEGATVTTGIADERNKVISLSWNADATDGATFWEVSSDGTDKETIGPIAYNATEAEVAAAFNAHPAFTAAANNVLVNQQSAGFYTVKFALTFADGPTIGATAQSNSLLVPVGDEQVVAVSTSASNAILGTSSTAPITLELEASDEVGEVGTIAELTTTLRKDLLQNNADVSILTQAWSALISKPDGTKQPFFVTADTDTARGLALQAAKTAAEAGDLITVGPGTYNTRNLLKNGVNWHFQPGAVVDDQSGTDGSLLSDGADGANGDVACTITGYGVFKRSVAAGAAANPHAILRVQDDDSQIVLEGTLLQNIGSDNNNACVMVDAGVVRVNAASIISQDYDAILVSAGTVNVTAGIATGGDGGIEQSSGTLTATIGVLTGVVAVDQTGGTLNLTAFRINGPVSTEGTVQLDVRNIVGGGIAIGSGTTIANNTRIDTSASSGLNPATVNGGTLIFNSCTLLAHSTRDSIEASAPVNVKVYGTTVANKAKDANVTIQVGTFVVDANVS